MPPESAVACLNQPVFLCADMPSELDEQSSKPERDKYYMTATAHTEPIQLAHVILITCLKTE